MISFACRDINFKDLIMCSFELNKTEYNVFMFLISHREDFTTTQIADELGLDRTTVQKAIKSLTDKNLVFRTQQNLEKGGYIFIYSIKDKEDVKKRMLSIVENWYDKVIKEIKSWY